MKGLMAICLLFKNLRQWSPARKLEKLISFAFKVQESVAFIKEVGISPAAPLCLLRHRPTFFEKIGQSEWRMHSALTEICNNKLGETFCKLVRENYKHKADTWLRAQLSHAWDVHL